MKDKDLELFYLYSRYFEVEFIFSTGRRERLRLSRLSRRELEQSPEPEKLWCVPRGRNQKDVRPLNVHEFRRFAEERRDPDELVKPRRLITCVGGAQIFVPYGLGLLPRQESFLLAKLPLIQLRPDPLGPEYVVEEWQNGAPLGMTRRVQVKPDDPRVFYAWVGPGTIDPATQAGRGLWGKFVPRGTERPFSDKLTAILRREGDGYSIRTAFVGDRSEPWPGDPNADYQKSTNFWKTGALVAGTVWFKPGSERQDCPWKGVR